MKSCCTEKELELAAEINNNLVIKAAVFANGQTDLFARDRLELVKLKAERYLASLIEEIKIIINWLSEEDDELNQYRLRIFYWVSWVKAVVVASDITLLPGNKIADITPRIIRLVGNYFDLFPNQIMLVEHYPVSSLSFQARKPSQKSEGMNRAIPKTPSMS